MRVTSLAILLVGAQGCVIAVEDGFTIDQPVERVVLDLGYGDVRVEPGASVVEVEAQLATLGDGDYGHELVDGVLYVDYACGGADLCGGDVHLRVPSTVALEIAVGAGDVTVRGMRGDLLVDLGTGAVIGTGLAGRTIEATTGTGGVRLELEARPSLVSAMVGTGDVDLVVPAGAYVLELDATAGAVETTGVTHDAAADAHIVAIAGAGGVTLTGE